MQTKIFTLHSFGPARKPMSHQALRDGQPTLATSRLIKSETLQLNNGADQSSLSKQASITERREDGKGNASTFSILGNRARVLDLELLTTLFVLVREVFACV